MTNLSTSGAFVILESATALHVALFATAQAGLLVVVFALGLAFDLAFAAALGVASFADVRQVPRLAAASALRILESAVGLDMALLATAKASPVSVHGDCTDFNRRRLCTTGVHGLEVGVNRRNQTCPVLRAPQSQVLL